MSDLLSSDFCLYEVTDIVYDRTMLHKDPLFSMNALVGELGELANVLKKEEYAYFLPDYKERLDKEVADGKRETFSAQRLDELGDCLFFFTQLVSACGFNLNQVWKTQLKKLSKQDKEYGRTFKK